MRLAGSSTSQYFRDLSRKSPPCRHCRRCLPPRGGSELFQHLVNLLAARVVKRQREGFAIVGDGPFILPDESERESAARKCGGDVGIEADRFVEVLYGAIVLLPSRIKQTAIEEGGGVARAEPDAFIIVRYGAILIGPVSQISVEVPLRFVPVGVGPREEPSGETAIEPDRPVAVFNRKINPPLVPARISPIGES